MGKWLLRAAVGIGAVLGGLLLLAFFTMISYRVPSSSMEPTLHCAKPASGCEASSMDRILVSRWTYDVRDPERGEIVAYKIRGQAATACGLTESATFIKRIIALPGDRWREQAGFLYVNGEKLEEPYIKQDRRDSDSIPEKTVPKGKYVLIGDNRGQSCDSRRVGPVSRDDIVGPLFAVYWPPKRIGFR
jgi:signal peptidase I